MKLPPYFCNIEKIVWTKVFNPGTPSKERKNAGFNVADLEPEITTLAERNKRANKKHGELVRPGLRV